MQRLESATSLIIDHPGRRVALCGVSEQADRFIAIHDRHLDV